MKIQKLIMVDFELNERLKKEENASALINHLLIEHFKHIDNPYMGMTPEQLSFEMKKLEVQEEAARKIKEIENGYS